MIHETRLIPIDSQPRPHLPKSIELDMGDPRGHWEGDTLVVETTNFRTRSIYRNANPETLRFTERFTRTAADKVRWSVTVEDPKTCDPALRICDELEAVGRCGGHEVGFRGRDQR